MYPSHNVNSLFIFREIPSQTLTGVISYTAETTKSVIFNANSHLSHLKFSWNESQSFIFKNPLYNFKEIIFLCSEMTVLVTLLRQNRPFSLLLRRFQGAFMLE